jgi:O-antigen ligase
MQTAQPTASPLGILLLVAAIYLVVTSPKKLRTVGRMGIAFVATALLIMVPGAILRIPTEDILIKPIEIPA